MHMFVCTHIHIQLQIRYSFKNHSNIIPKHGDSQLATEKNYSKTKQKPGMGARWEGGMVWWLEREQPHRLLCLVTVGTAWEGLGGVDLLKQVCHWGAGL